MASTSTSALTLALAQPCGIHRHPGAMSSLTVAGRVMEPVALDTVTSAPSSTPRSEASSVGMSTVGISDPPVRVGSPSLIRDGRSGTITARVLANNPGDGTGDWERITLFDVEGLRSTKLDGKPNGYQGRLTLHDGVDVLLNRALFNRDFDAGPFTPGMRLGSFFMDVAPQG